MVLLENVVQWGQQVTVELLEQLELVVLRA